MKLQNEKKELWRYASKNLTAPVCGTTRQQQQPRRPQHQRHPQQQEFGTMMTHSRPASLLECYDGYGESSTSMMGISRQENLSTPPPPYSSVSELDCSSGSKQDYRLRFRQHQPYLMDGDEEECAFRGTDSDTDCSRKPAPITDGCNYGNSGDITLVDDYEKLNETSMSSSSFHLSSEWQKKQRRLSPISQKKIPSSLQGLTMTTKTTTTTTAATITTTATISSTTSLAATAVRILRNCCGGTFGSSNSVISTPSSNGNNNNYYSSSSRIYNNNSNKNMANTINACSKLNYEHPKSYLDQHSTNSIKYLKQYFNTLMNQLEPSQIKSLLKAVKSRHDQIVPIIPAASASSSSPPNYQTNCILIRRAEIFGEDPYVIACRLFFWRDLRNASQLKRLPVCPNERDPVYVCCNPLHWCRILETETAPPPYHSQSMNQIEGEKLQNVVNSTSSGSTDPDNIRQNYSDLHLLLSESVTTDGEGRLYSPNWCEVAYWEMAQRVGERYPADTPTINIFSDRPCTTSGDHNDGMCLKELVEKRKTPSPGDVESTRKKIGLGVTLSQESDGVWLYNRSTVPVFVYSPTIAESWYRVCRVEPGDCLRAFDKYRAQSLKSPAQLPGFQTGPFDKFSMRISFAKGWGQKYKRPDITLCPCWLEVLFRPQR